MGNILIIDDEKNICYILRLALTGWGYEVKIAYDGEEGIALFTKDYNFDLVVTDIRMPGMDGNEVAKYIRSSDRSDTPIVVITSFDGEDINRELFNFLLIKPFDLEVLKEVIRSLT